MAKMTKEKFLKMKSVRFLIFMWIVVFPIIYIALPTLKMATGEAETNLTPLWAFGVWILTPWAASILWKWFGGESEVEKDTE